MKLDVVECIAKCQCGRISFKLKRFDKWFNISEKSFLIIFKLKTLPDDYLPVYKCERCISLWKKDKGTIGERLNRIMPSWFDD